MRLQATGSFHPDEGYSFSFVVGDSPLISFEGFTEEEVIYMRDLFDIILPEDKCLTPLNAADEVSVPQSKIRPSVFSKIRQSLRVLLRKSE